MELHRLDGEGDGAADEMFLDSGLDGDWDTGLSAVTGTVWEYADGEAPVYATETESYAETGSASYDYDDDYDAIPRDLVHQAVVLVGAQSGNQTHPPRHRTGRAQ